MRPNWSGSRSASRISQPDVLRKVIEKTDGVPLYIEEFTKAVVESRQAAITAATSQVVIPASLHDSLLARLDLLGEAKGVAQLASMLGREFGRDVLAAVWTGTTDSLAAGSRAWSRRNSSIRPSDGARERYLFKHALIQDAAYESLLKSSRVAHHRRIAEVLETQFTDVVAEQPEVVAHHYAAGRVPERAAQLWLDAGQRRCAATRTSKPPRTCAVRSARRPNCPTRRSDRWPNSTCRSRWARRWSPPRATRRPTSRPRGRARSSCARSSATCRSSSRRCSDCGCTNACAPITGRRSLLAANVLRRAEACKATTC